MAKYKNNKTQTIAPTPKERLASAILTANAKGVPSESLRRYLRTHHGIRATPQDILSLKNSRGEPLYRYSRALACDDLKGLSVSLREVTPEVLYTPREGRCGSVVSRPSGFEVVVVDAEGARLMSWFSVDRKTAEATYCAAVIAHENPTTP